MTGFKTRESSYRGCGVEIQFENIPLWPAAFLATSRQEGPIWREGAMLRVSLSSCRNSQLHWTLTSLDPAGRAVLCAYVCALESAIIQYMCTKKHACFKPQTKDTDGCRCTYTVYALQYDLTCLQLFCTHLSIMQCNLPAIGALTCKLANLHYEKQPFGLHIRS